MKYELEDKDFQAKLDSYSKLNKFSERLQEACKNQMSNSYNTVTVCFGDLLVPDDRIFGESHGFQNRLVILKSDIEVLEDLKPGVWHKREEFDGNPNGRLLVERYEDDEDTQEALNHAINFL